MRDKPTNTTAWPPGPWRKGELGENQFDVYDANGESIIEPSDRAEFVSHEAAKLTALAPEMAEAVLAWSTCGDGYCCEPGHAKCSCYDTMMAMAERIRAIGASNVE